MGRLQFSIRALFVAALVGGVLGAIAIQRARQHDIVVVPASDQPSMWTGQLAADQPSTQIVFAAPEGMTITWDVTAPGAFDSEPLVAPARYNFPQGAIYRLKLTNIPGREGVEIYPTIEVAPALPHTDAYLAQNAVPLAFTEEDFDQILSGKGVTKVIYLPDPDYRELALAGVETLVSTRLYPGLDPIIEADRRGAILSIVRVGSLSVRVGNLSDPGAWPRGGFDRHSSKPVPFAP